LAEWLRRQGHDVVEAKTLGPDPGDRKLLEIAAEDDRILVTIDTDFGKHVFVDGMAHSGVARLPDVPASRRTQLMAQEIDRHGRQLERGAIVTARGNRIRLSSR
jgi:predicted nuclease of predicted toxin-antitoxin system